MTGIELKSRLLLSVCWLGFEEIVGVWYRTGMRKGWWHRVGLIASESFHQNDMSLGLEDGSSWDTP